MSGKIVCGDCGRTATRPGTPVPRTGSTCGSVRPIYVKRGTCATSHLYQDVLLAKMSEALQVLAGRNRAAVDLTLDSLRAMGARRRPSTLHAAIDKLLTESPTQLAFDIPDFLAVLEGGCRLTDGRLGFVFITGEAVTLDLPQRWSPMMRPGKLAATGRC